MCSVWLLQSVWTQFLFLAAECHDNVSQLFDAPFNWVKKRQSSIEMKDFWYFRKCCSIRSRIDFDPVLDVEKETPLIKSIKLLQHQFSIWDVFIILGTFRLQCYEVVVVRRKGQSSTLSWFGFQWPVWQCSNKVNCLDLKEIRLLSFHFEVTKKIFR